MAASQFGPTTQITQAAPKQAVQPGFVDASGNLQPGRIDGSGNIQVAVTGAGSGGTSSVDEATFTAGTTAGTPAMGAYQVTPSALTDNQLGIIALDEDRNVKVNIVAGSSGNSAAGPTGDPVPTDADFIGFSDASGNLTGVAATNLDYDTGAGTIPQTVFGIALPANGSVVAGGTATNPIQVSLANTAANATPVLVDGTGGTFPITGPVEVEQATAADLNATVVGTGTFAVQVSSSTLPTGAATLAEQQTQTTALGTLLTTTDFNAAFGAAGTADTQVLTVQGIASMTPVQVSQATASNLNAQVVGSIADDATTPGNPVMVGGFAKSPDGTDPSSVAENDVARLITDLNRRVFVNTVHPRFGHKHLNGSTAYTDESIVADPGDGFQVVITNIIASTGAATALNFFLEEGSTTIFGPIYLEAVAGRGFASGPIALPVTASTAVTLTSSASIAQSFDIDYFIQAV